MVKRWLSDREGEMYVATDAPWDKSQEQYVLATDYDSAVAYDCCGCRARVKIMLEAYPRGPDVVRFCPVCGSQDDGTVDTPFYRVDKRLKREVK